MLSATAVGTVELSQLMTVFFPSSPKSPTMPLADIADLSEPKPQHTFALDSNQFQQSCHEEKTMFHENDFQTYLRVHVLLVVHLLSCEPDQSMGKTVKKPVKATMFLIFSSFLPSSTIIINVPPIDVIPSGLMSGHCGQNQRGPEVCSPS